MTTHEVVRLYKFEPAVGSRPTIDRMYFGRAVMATIVMYLMIVELVNFL